MTRFLSAGLVVGLTLSASSFAAAPAFLRNLVGCFEVTYKYVEEGNVVYPYYRETSHEWVVLNEEANDNFRLQHYGVVGEGADVHVMLHWGQRWNQVRDGWRQQVLAPDGTARYECTAPVRENAVRNATVAQRRCEALRAPKPRRDRRRADYATLDRVHIWNITADGWQDVQHNVKRTAVAEGAQEGTLVSRETGWNEYRRVPQAACQAAIDHLARPR